ncbi:MAG TPA: hypothetical protein VIM29_09850 [Bacillota bacterium]
MKGLKLLGKGTLCLLLGVMFTLFLANSVLASELVPAKIEKFVTDSPVIRSGATAKLYWKVSGASHIEIIGIEKSDELDLPLEGSIEVWPLTTTSYILVAYGLDGIVISKALTINVDVKGEVRIEYFKATSTQVTPGETVMLSWKVVNGTSVRVIGISPKDDEFLRPIEGATEAWPETTTTYLLEAIGYKGEVTSAAITVNVKDAPKPQILSFTASKTEIRRGDMITLNWKTENVVGCEIVTSSGAKLPNRPPNGSIAVTPNTTTTFTLIARDATGAEAKAEVTITVK